MQHLHLEAFRRFLWSQSAKWCQSSLAIDSSERPFAQESSQLERSRRWGRTRKQSIRKENGMISINQSQQNMASYLEGGNLD